MLNNLSIRIKIILAQIFLIAVVSIFIYSYYPNQQKQAALAAIESKILSISNMFSIGVGIGMGETDLVAVSEALNWTHTDSSVVYILVRDNNHQTIGSFRAKGVDVPADLDNRVASGKFYNVGKIIYYRADILYQNVPFGTLTIGYSLETIEEHISQLKRTTMYFGLGLFTVGVILSFFISNMITVNIRKLDSTVKAISSGDENVRVEVNGKDEIAKLGGAFNHMLFRLDRSRKELVRYAEQLKKQNEELNQFSYVVSHDLKAPLRAIFKLSQWIEEDSKDSLSQESVDNMKTLRGRVFRLEALINGLLEYSKIGRTNIRMERVDVGDMLRETIDLLNPPAHIVIDIQKDMPVFNTKKILLQQVFINLISNAVKYNDKKKGLVQISVNNDRGFYEFTIQDNGMGIAPMYHKKVFEIFQTLESRDKVEGTGIGLAIIKKSVDDMGGEIILDSEEGKGARFSFTWPKEELQLVDANQN
jgi:signal transduction histidine kinase